MPKHRPRVLLLADIPGWAYDFTARSLAHHLAPRYAVSIAYTSMKPRLNPRDYDLLYAFYWADRSPTELGFEPDRVIREVASYRWATTDWYGRLSPADFVSRYLADCGIVTTPALFLQKLLGEHHRDTFLVPKGYEPGLFSNRRPRSGPLRIGWVGNPDDESKGLRDILLPATEGRFEFEYSPGTWNRSRGAWSRARVGAFYNTIDVLAVASRSEGQPLCLIEAMAAGCFPVAVNTGIVPELVRPEANGLIVERSVAAFAEAFDWCTRNLDEVRRAGSFNTRLMEESRPWSIRARRFAELFDYALARLDRSPVRRPPLVEPPPILLRSLHEAPSGKQVVHARNDDSDGPGLRPDLPERWRWRASDALVRTRTLWKESPDRLLQGARRVLPESLRHAFRRSSR
jgi:hypothetical protein